MLLHRSQNYFWTCISTIVFPMLLLPLLLQEWIHPHAIARPWWLLGYLAVHKALDYANICWPRLWLMQGRISPIANKKKCLMETKRSGGNFERGFRMFFFGWILACHVQPSKGRVVLPQKAPHWSKRISFWQMRNVNKMINFFKYKAFILPSRPNTILFLWL